MSIEFRHGKRVLCTLSDFQGMQEIKETRELLAYENSLKEEEISIYEDGEKVL